LVGVLFYLDRRLGGGDLPSAGVDRLRERVYEQPDPVLWRVDLARYDERSVGTRDGLGQPLRPLLVASQRAPALGRGKLRTLVDVDPFLLVALELSRAPGERPVDIKHTLSS